MDVKTKRESLIMHYGLCTAFHGFLLRDVLLDTFLILI